MIISILLALLVAQLAFATSSVTTLFSLPANASWLENLAYRPSTNTILATRLDVAQLWAISASTGAGTILASVANITALVGITQTRSSPDEFYIAGLNFTSAGVQPNSSALWKLTFPLDGGFTFESAFGVPGMTLINGLTTWNETTILATDSYQGSIWEINLSTKSSTRAFTDPTMARIDENGVNGVKVLRSSKETYVYYTSTDQALLARIPVDPVTARALGPADVIAHDIGAADDFALLPDGSAVIATGSNNTIVHVSLGGRVEVVAGSPESQEVASGTACQFGEDGVLYVTTGGSAAAGRVAAVDLGED
ncbi:hypothetical protein N0V93_003312 [Gnomoniopsis smithogilvyi]|uniref:Cyclic nucleotide-binding domain-containing protein n=1 Tax=Gnomoniopsis smithogilvyi TaxID=1191159 RepID=A0A9W8YWE7_9PEZI|nr:hypothetical protein N0V93_003312 [Gnomoniopsis smithogilvyi]